MSVSDLADLFDVDRATVRRRCRGLQRNKGPRGAAQYRSTEVLPRMAGSDDTEKPSAQRDRQQARLAEHRANLAQLQEQEQRGQLVPIDEAMRILGDMVAVIRNRLMALPVRLAGELPVKLAVRKKAEQHLTDSVYAVLHELADALEDTPVEQVADDLPAKAKGKGKK